MTRTKSLRLEHLETREVPAAALALGAFGGANANNLFRFDTATPGTIDATIPITGTLAGDVFVGIDFRPATGQLYGVAANLIGNTMQVYTIDPTTGTATAVGAPAAVAGLAGSTAFGVDFNPVADRIRVVTNLPSDGPGGNTNNFRLDPNTGALVAIDPDLDYTTLTGGVGAGPEVAVAYTNSGFTAATPATTTLFGIAQGSSSLIQNGGAAPGFPTLTTVGPLGVTLTSASAGLDFVGPGNAGFALLTTAAGPQLFSVNPTTGAATLLATVGSGVLNLSDVTLAPPLSPVAVTGAANGAVNLFVATNGQAAAGPVVNAFPGSAIAPRATTGDVNGDGVADTIAVTGPGTPIRVTVISGVDNSTVLVAPFDPFGGDFTGGGFVASADIDNDGRAEFVVTPDQGGGPRVTIFSLPAGGGTTATVRANFFGIDDENFRGGARSALGDINNDGTADIAVAAGFLGGPRTAIFNGTTLLTTPTRLIGDFFAFPGEDAVRLRNGAYVAISDINGDSFDDLIFGGGPGGAPRVFILSGQLVSANNVAGAQAAPIANFFVANNSTDRGGIRVAGADVDGDTRGDLVVGSGEGSPARIRVYRGVNFTTNVEPTVFQDLTVFGGATLPGGVFVG